MDVDSVDVDGVDVDSVHVDSNNKDKAELQFINITTHIKIKS
jgi:hypothetical protein